jgi:hypothetical protein
VAARRLLRPRVAGLGRDLTLAGILYHLALNEEDWFEVRFLGLPERKDWQGIDWEADPDHEFRTALTKEPDWLRRRYRVREAIDGTVGE